jgi:hypothetical protein
MNIAWVKRDELASAANHRIMHTQVVLDVGPGIRPQSYFEPGVHICIEPYLPYIERQQKVTNFDPRFVYLNSTWDVAMGLLPAKSVDSVFALDVIEHFEKQDGLKFLREAERVARHQIVIFTPLGYYPQAYDETHVRDRWGMDGGMWQAHHSGWLPEDFGEGWDFICCEAAHLVDQHEQLLDKPIGAIWAFRNLNTTKYAASIRKKSDKWVPTGTRFLRKVIKRVKHAFR